MEDENTAQNFGGPWTIMKLKTLEGYLNAYSNVLRNQPYQVVYIDGFAGDGRVLLGTDKDAAQLTLWPSLAQREIPGSAELACRQDRINHFLFIDTNRRHYSALVSITDNRANMKSTVQIKTGDCNRILPLFLSTFNPDTLRGLAFLDPFGMQLEWDTLRTVAEVPGLDIWYWFSLEGVLRQAPRHRSKLTPDKQNSLDRVLPPSAWEDLYRGAPGFFQDQGLESARERVEWRFVLQLVTDHLRSLFVEVLEPCVFPKVGAPRFALYFMMTNPDTRPRQIATRIANSLLKGARLST